MAEITLDELLTETKVRPERLDKGISDDHLCEIALFLTSWRTVASHLKLKEIDLDAVEREGKDEQEKRLKALQKWRGKFAFKATYRKLVEVLLSLGMADVAEKICCLLKEDSVSVTNSSSAECEAQKLYCEQTSALTGNALTPPPLENEPPQLETEPPLLETEPPPMETEPPRPETKPPPLETELPQLETEPPQLETKHPRLGMELSLLETEIAAFIKKALSMVPQVHRKRKLEEDLEMDQPAPKKHIMNGSSDSEGEGAADHFNGAIPHAAHQSEDIPPTYKHGHECEIIDPPPWTTALRTTCPICLQVLRNPQQTTCGHTFCEVCIELAQDSQKQTCPECKMTNISVFLHESLRRLLNDLQVRCTIQDKEGACDWTGKLRELDNHLNLKNPTAPDHLLTGCKFVTLQCEFSYVGCEAQIPRKDMAIHMKVAQSYHNQLLVEKVKKQAREIEELTMKLRTKEEETACTIQQMRQEFALQLQSKDEAIAQMQEEFTLQLQRKDEELVRFAHQMKEISSLLQSKDKELVEKNKEIAQLKQDKPTPHIHPVNFCFTVDKFKYQMENEVEWVSKPFYTHPQGYKMCVEVFINGLDSNKYVSLYTCIMKGENDDELSWPFYGKLTVELLNQKSDDHHHVYTIHYDKSIPQHYCERVLIGERNRGWGNHRFISHSKISQEDSIVQYVKDDCIKFRISVVLLYS